MKKKAEREFVDVRPEVRGDRTTFVITWYPQRGDRRRLRFQNEKAVNRKADQIEDWMRRSHEPMTPELQKEIQVAVMLRDQLAPGVPLAKIVQEYAKFGPVNSVSIDTEAAGRAFIVTRSDWQKYAERTRRTIRNHMERFIRAFGPRPLSSITHEEIERYLTKNVGGCAKTQNQHLITIRSFFRWARIKKQWLIFSQPSAAELVDPPKVNKSEHEVFSPEEFTRILVFTPTRLLPYMLLGQFAGIRSEERMRMQWSCWRAEEDNKLVLSEDITKTNQRRRVDVAANLSDWLIVLRGAPTDLIVPERHPFRFTTSIFKAAGVRSKKNALRAGFASYHQALFENPVLTAKLDGHTVKQLEDYTSITGVTKKTAQEMFDITPSLVTDFAHKNNLPTPAWACKFGLAAAA